ncbi:hypothetical protein, partial [Leptospira borgpetersenii]|uniref:hypothetical protein n=1 Tax=Leptospira borgpetersenii TaxID=174 RepID=UPI001D1338A6
IGGSSLSFLFGQRTSYLRENGQKLQQLKRIKPPITSEWPFFRRLLREFNKHERRNKCEAFIMLQSVDSYHS